MPLDSRKRYHVAPLTPEQQALVLQWKPLACKIARQFSPNARGHDWDDVESWAMEGLVLAAQRFDPTRGIRFNTYAWAWIRQALFRSRKAWAKHHRIDPLSFSVMNARTDSGDLPEFDPESDYLDEDVTRGAVVRDLIANCRKWVDHRSWEVLTMRFRDGMYLDEIAALIDTTKERVRQIEGQALAKIRERMALEYAEIQQNTGGIAS